MRAACEGVPAPIRSSIHNAATRAPRLRNGVGFTASGTSSTRIEDDTASSDDAGTSHGTQGYTARQAAPLPPVRRRSLRYGNDRYVADARAPLRRPGLVH